MGLACLPFRLTAHSPRTLRLGKTQRAGMIECARPRSTGYHRQADKHATSTLLTLTPLFMDGP
jgi:hypothetical protein